ncbi:hypothetical protein CR513_30107, partial [Mucuna pruriens]
MVGGTTKEYKAILAMLKKEKLHYPNQFLSSSLLDKLDIKATNHVYHSSSLFCCHKKIKLIIVKLLDGSQVFTNITENYIPSFNFNLIFVSKLAMSLDYKLTFDHDNLSLNTIGVAKLEGGLYIVYLEYRLDFFALLCLAYETWTPPLIRGLPKYIKIPLWLIVIKMINIVIHLSHMDILELISLSFLFGHKYFFTIVDDTTKLSMPSAL